jgi:mRNA-degrading endonuclease RelE of RelBE toxin-antitoxin system
MNAPPGFYVVEVVPLAERELDEMRAFDARPILRAIWSLTYEAETATRNRRPLDETMPGLPEGCWEVRVGSFRVLYQVANDRTVTVLRVILKGRRTLEEALNRSRRE